MNVPKMQQSQNFSCRTGICTVAITLELSNAPKGGGDLVVQGDASFAK